MELKKGSTRWVLLVRNIAIKFASPENFIKGMKCNFIESNKEHKFIAPVHFNFFNIFIIMSRCKELHWSFPLEILEPIALEIGSEVKVSSFGTLNGEVVCFDCVD